ncbi:Zn-ribbon domain-containing OB-fold protein [Halosegnis marinus]|uniref:Zn-ribbon domain-containing OB-fold protein n=1 Tax=Halosegnis marinus TaxID=3034023 RepID=A0ABD5ZS17_9EURY|nr:OB-fold domain-containing protein [Halosegnis sp. DT85]
MSLDAGRCPDGHVTYPPHPRCPECGEEQTDTVDLSGDTATVVTWTTSYATPPGVREPNTLAIVAFDGHDVRALGQVEGEVDIGDTVEPVHVEELRDPDAGIREPESQAWDGYRFERVE